RKMNPRLTRRRRPPVEAYAVRRSVDLHDRRHDDGQIRPAAADGFGTAKRLDGEKGEDHYVADRPEQLFEVLRREVRLELSGVDAAFIEGFEFPDLVTRRFGGYFFTRMDLSFHS